MIKKAIYLRSDVLKVGLSSEGIFAYVALSVMQNKTNVLYTTPQAIWFTMCGTDVPLTRDLKDKLVHGLAELHEFRIINFKMLSASFYEIDTSRLDFDTEHIFYERVYTDELRKICSYQGKVNKFDFVRYFITILSSFENHIKIVVDNCEKKRVTTCHPMNLYQKITGLSRATVVKYNAALEELKVLFVISNPKSHISNYYCRYENKDAVLEYLRTNNLINKD